MEENQEFLQMKAQDSTLSETEKQNTAKTRKPRAKKEVIPVTVVEVVNPTEDRITQELVKHNITESVLAKMENDFLSLTIADVNDKDGYKAVNDARILCKNTRVLAVKLCKDRRAAAIKEQKDWIATEDRIETRIKRVEDDLAAKQKVIDDIKEAERLEKETKEQARLQERAVKLIGLGMNFDGTSYILEDVKISVVQVKQLDEFTFGQLLSGVEAKFKENQEIKQREEELRLEAEANNKRILEEQLRIKEENERKERELVAREQAIKDAEEKAKRDAEERIRQEELALKAKAEAELARREHEKQEKIKSRMSALFAIGYSQQGNTLIFSTLSPINIDNLHLVMDESWNTFLAETTKLVNQRKMEIDQERIAREERIKAEAIAAERKRAEEEAEADRIAALEKAETEEKERQRLAMLLPDEEKFNKFCKVIASVPVPEFTIPAYIEFAKTIKADVLTILKTLHSKKPN